MNAKLRLLPLWFVPAAAFAQGPLTPPVGAPVASMKTLQQIEPRTAIGGSSATVNLSTAGSYYLTGDITVANGSGIVISGVKGLTLDLNGFTIKSTSSAVFDGEGILITGTSSGISIRNGHIISGTTVSGSGSSASTTNHGFKNGVLCDLQVSNVDLDGLTISGTNTGIGCSTDSVRVNPETVRASNVSVNTVEVGIYASSIIHCNVSSVGSALLGQSVESSVGFSEKGTGIRATRVIATVETLAGTVLNSTGESASNGHGIYGGQVTNSQGRSGGGSGIVAVNAMNCTAYATTTSNPGMTVTTATNCTAQAGLIGITGETLMNCTGKGVNGGSAGITVSRSATNCSGIGVAFGIDGYVSGAAKAVLTGCYGEGSTALRCKLATSCTGTGAITATNTYNMP